MSVVAQVDGKVASALWRAGLAGEGKGLVVGCSGGADSTALLYSLYRLQDACSITLRVAHLNHDFRGEEADEDARFVERMASELSLPFSVAKQDPIAYQRERHISSFEQGAREMRYQFLAEVAEEAGAPAVAVGHTTDDLAETVLLHILRGTGLAGLRGMTEIAPWPWPTGLESPMVFRPLLEVTKAETVGYCRELGRSYRTDSGNSMFRFTRNRVRHELMPSLADGYNPRVQEALARLANTAALDLDYMEQELDRHWPELANVETISDKSGDPSVAVILERSGLTRLHPSLQRMALRRAFAIANGDPRRLNESHLRTMTIIAGEEGRDRTMSLPGGLSFQVTPLQVAVRQGRSAIECPYPELTEPFDLPMPSVSNRPLVCNAGEWEVTLELLPNRTQEVIRPPDDFTAYFAPDSLSGGLWVRSREEGDRFQPLGMRGSKKLHDFFIDAKVPRDWRDRVPLLVGRQGIAWVVGHRTADWARVTEPGDPEALLLRIRFRLND